MESLIDLHTKVLQLIEAIKTNKTNDLSDYLIYLEQIDRILISLDIISHGNKA